MKIKILDCKLLSIEEANKVDESIRRIDKYWWLRSCGNDIHYAAYVGSDGRINTYGVHVSHPSYVRPALYLESNIGKSFKLASHDWINVFDNVYLCENFIEYKMFDAEYVQYESSYIQNYILSWFRSQGLEFNTNIEI